MGTKKLVNISSSPPISYSRHCDSSPQQTGNGNNKNSCYSVAPNTNTMFTKLRNYFTQIKKSATTSSAQRRHNHRHHEKLTNCNSIPTHNSNNRNNSSSSSSSITSSSMFNIISIIMLVLLALINTTASNPVFVDNPSLAQFQSGRNIRHLPCIVRKSGRSGVCMFAIDCIKQNGTHLGTCIDRFYFGSCCDIKEEGFPEIADNSIDQNTISHRFTPESSTVPASALFKLTTLSPAHYHSNISSSVTSGSSSSSSSSNTATQQDVTQMLNSVTQTFAVTTLDNTPRPTTLITNSNSGKLNKSTTTTTTKPSTHKQSQFVIRTTVKPTKIATGYKPTHFNTTTKKNTTPATSATTMATTTTITTTTTRRPILTTTEGNLQQDELQAEATTQPTKLFTYQIVETTTYTPTEPTKIIDFVTTERISPSTTKKPQTTSTTTTTTTTEAPRTSTTTTSTTTTTTTPRTTTSKPKPQTTRKPTTTKKPTTQKRTTVKPTRKPITTTIDLNTQTNATTAHTTHGPSSTISLASNKTTNAPRPKPKPTASIVKVSKPTTTATTSTTSTTTTTKTTQKPTVSTTTIQTPTEANKNVQSTTTTNQPTTPTSTTITTTPASTTIKATQKPVITSSTHKPGLVTWTNIDGEPVVEPINSDWIPVTTEASLNANNKVEEQSSTDKTTYEEMDVSVSSSVSAMMNNHTVVISKPQKPATTTTITTSTATKVPTNAQPIAATSTTAKPTTSTTTTQKPTSTSTLTSTEQPEPSSTTVSHQFTTEGIPSTTATTSSGFTTEDYTTESLNLNGTTMPPVSNSLEGVDYRQVCGRRMFPEPRIVGGSNAAFGRWPWQISLRQWRTSTYLHKCGAALLNENWAITAAHCVDNVPPSDLLLRLGEYDLAEEEEPYGYQERRVQIVASHPQFDPRTFEYDLALLRFYEPVVFQPNIIPVCVPQDDENFIGQTAFVTGWGRLYEDGPLPSVLQEVAVPVINNTICESMYRSAGYIEHIPHIFICAGWKKGGYDSCEGDSGGPMVLQRESDKRFQLGGVISWGIGCAEANQPGVYTRISEFRDWINQILQF